MTTYREKSRDIMIVLIIVMIGILIRMPFDKFSTVDYTRLNDPDSFYYARKAIEFYNEPISKWELFSFRSEDSLMNSITAENSIPSPNLLPISIALIAKTCKTDSIGKIIYYFSAIICSLSAIPAYVFVKKHTNRWGGIVAGLAVAIAPSYFMHTMYGYCDTDGLIMLLAITFVICQIESFFEHDMLKKIFLCVASCVSILLFYLTWEKYYVYALISFGLVVIVALINWIKKFGYNIWPTCVMSILILVFCMFISGQDFVGYVGGVFRTNLNWPVESYFIGELEKPAFVKGGPNNSFLVHPTGVVNWLGGIPIVFLVLISIAFFVVYIVKNWKKAIDEKNVENELVFILLIAWSLVATVIVITGIRFVQLLALPLCLLVGLGVGAIVDTLRGVELSGLKKNLLVLFLSIMAFGSLMSASFYFACFVSLIILILGVVLNKVNTKYGLILLVIFAFVCPIVNEYRIVHNSGPFVSEDLVDAMEYIDENTNEDSMLVSWWGYGYFFQYASNRKVVADGGIYNGEYFYWLANIFTTEDESLSAGICRMLKSGSIDGSLLAENYIGDAKTSAQMIKEILVINENDAYDIMVEEYGLSDNEAKSILKYTHPDVSNDMYLIVYDDIKSTVAPIAYFGLWNFEGDRFFETKYDEVKDKYIYPKELKNSLIVRYLENGNSFGDFESVYSNDTVSVFKVPND